MIVDWFQKAKKLNKDVGREAATFNDRDSMKFLATFIGKKGKIMDMLSSMNNNFNSLLLLSEKYTNATGSTEESKILEDINEINNVNARNLRICNKLLSEMKNDAKLGKYDAQGRLIEDFTPETRVKIGINNALQTRIYKVLQRSQVLQVDVKKIIKEKISRQVRTAKPDLSEEEVSELIENPIQVQEVLQRAIFSQAPDKIRNAIQDMNYKYKELTKLESNMKALFEMIQELSMIVKSQTEVLNSIEENLKGTCHYMESAEKKLTSAKEEYLTGQERLCCIAVLVVIIALVALYPVIGLIL